MLHLSFCLSMYLRKKPTEMKLETPEANTQTYQFLVQAVYPKICNAFSLLLQYFWVFLIESSFVLQLLQVSVIAAPVTVFSSETILWIVIEAKQQSVTILYAKAFTRFALKTHANTTDTRIFLTADSSAVSALRLRSDRLASRPFSSWAMPPSESPLDRAKPVDSLPRFFFLVFFFVPASILQQLLDFCFVYHQWMLLRP